MKIQFLTGVSSMIGSFAKGQVAEVEGRVAEQWVRANFARAIVASAPPAPTPVPAVEPEPLPAKAPATAPPPAPAAPAAVRRTTKLKK